MLGYNDLSSHPSLPWLINLPLPCRSVTRDAITGQSKQTVKKVRARQITIVRDHKNLSTLIVVGKAFSVRRIMALYLTLMMKILRKIGNGPISIPFC